MLTLYKAEDFPHYLLVGGGSGVNQQMSNTYV